MSSSTYLSRSLALLLFIVSPLYLATRGSTSLSDIAFIFSSLSERAEALCIELTSQPTVPPISTFNETYIPRDVQRKISSPLPDGLAHSINSFEQYPFIAEHILQRKHLRYSKQTPAQRSLSNKLGYPVHFEKSRKGVEVNTMISEMIVQIARDYYNTGPQILEDSEQADFGLVDLTWGHLSRDWSSQGIKERQAVFPPIMTQLEQHFGGNESGKKVLVPGSALGRLASDIADLGASHLNLPMVDEYSVSCQMQDTMSQLTNSTMPPFWHTIFYRTTRPRCINTLYSPL